jgi:hypothetical protein
MHRYLTTQLKIIHMIRSILKPFYPQDAPWSVLFTSVAGAGRGDLKR